VVVGEPEQITIPVLDRFKAVSGRLRGLHFVRTSFNSTDIDNDDLVDLALLRLDSLSVLTGDEHIRSLKTVHLLPPDPAELIPHATLANTDPHNNNIDYRRFIEDLENEIDSKTKLLYEVKQKRAAILVGAFATGADTKASTGHMAELKELAVSAGFDVLGIMTQSRNKLHPRTVVGAGKLTEIMITALMKGADTIIFDNNLSPAQMKAVSSFAEVTVLDRTQLILEIFEARAVSNEGKIRVELARLRYMLPYLTMRDDALSRIAMGGVSGTGSRGPGETKMELDRRRVDERISFLSGKLKKIERNRVVQRRKRTRNDVPVVSIIGYTNAGKSTLLNTLTQSDVYADDRLFATLDTSSKRIRFPEEREVIITDTVGFIRDLPADLAGAFKSTLEEVAEADLLLHVVDASSGYTRQHIQSVKMVLKELELDDKQIIIAFNKIDLISDEALELLRADEPDAVFISAMDKRTLISLMQRMNRELFFATKNPLL
jgi:GTP-binding protein HflX